MSWGNNLVSGSWVYQTQSCDPLSTFRQTR